MHYLEVRPAIANTALTNILLQYGLITNSLLTPGYLVNAATFNYIAKLNHLENLSKSIIGDINKAVNGEYLKTLHEIIAALATHKKMSADALYEILATEIQSIMYNIEKTQKLKKQKEIEQAETIKLFAIIGAGVTLSMIVLSTISWGFNAFNQNIFNNQEVRRLTTENQTLKSKAAKYDQYLKDIESVDKTLAENERLKTKNKALNDELAECKGRPIWNPCN